MNTHNTPPTPTSRRAFLKRLALVAAAPFAVKALARQEIAPLPAPEPLPRNPAWIAHDLFEAQGLAIKVPSNRHLYWDYVSTGGARPFMVTYHGDWDGTFKPERGCTNPAYILADLYERTGEEPDWVVSSQAELIRTFGSTEKPHLNRQLIYDWGQWCDEPVWHCHLDGHRYGGASRFVINTTVSTPEEMTTLRDSLRMHCLRWQSTDPRYRTSYPVITATFHDTTH